MKNTNTCPKCPSTDIILIPAQPNNSHSNYIAIGMWAWQTVPVTRFLCGNCGFSEEWIVGKNWIEQLRKRFGQ